MKDEILTISWKDKNGDKHPWIKVGHYFNDPKHPNRKFCYKENSPQTIYFEDAKNLNEVMAYLWENVINVDMIANGEIEIIIEKA